jgi:hypothetical protein
MSKVTVHAITYNEEVIIEFFINHYRKMFPGCTIKIWDNYSTDKTVEIASQYDCEIYYYDSGNFLDDRKYIEIKNNCWKDAETDWVIVCDADELLLVNEKDLEELKKDQIAIISFEGYTLVNKKKEIDLENMNLGFRDTMYDKSFMFNKSYVKEINYSYGSHKANPVLHNGKVLQYSKTFIAHHYKYLSLDYSVARKNLYAERISEWNKKTGAGYEYYMSDEDLKKKAPKLHLETVYSSNDLIRVK